MVCERLCLCGACIADPCIVPSCVFLMPMRCVHLRLCNAQALACSELDVRLFVDMQPSLLQLLKLMEAQLVTNSALLRKSGAEMRKCEMLGVHRQMPWRLNMS